LIPHLRPDPKINTLFQTCFKISSLVQTDVKALRRAFVDGIIDNDEKVASSKNTY